MRGEMIHIGRAASRTGLSQRTLRHWEEAGLVAPSGRSEGGFRLYTDADVERLLLIRRMKPLGYSIEEMRALLGIVDRLRADPEDRDARDRLAGFVADTARRRESLVRQLAMADEFAALLDGL